MWGRKELLCTEYLYYFFWISAQLHLTQDLPFESWCFPCWHDAWSWCVRERRKSRCQKTPCISRRRRIHIFYLQRWPSEIVKGIQLHSQSKGLIISIMFPTSVDTIFRWGRERTRERDRGSQRENQRERERERDYRFLAVDTYWWPCQLFHWLQRTVLVVGARLMAEVGSELGRTRPWRG